MVVGLRLFQFRRPRIEKRRRSASVAFLRGCRVGWVSVLAVLPLLGACAPKVSAGEWQCPSDGGASDDGTSKAPLITDPVTVPWSTGFEDGFCDYTELAGYCYGDSVYTVAPEQHRSGRFSAT